MPTLLAPLAVASTSSYPNVGQGVIMRHTIGGVSGHWLGANAGPNGSLVWCIEWDAAAPRPDQLFSPAALVTQDQRGDTPAELRLNPGQMYTAMSRYQGVDEATSRAALSVLAHANYDTGSYVPATLDHIRSAHAAVWAKAASYADWARKNTPQNVHVPEAFAPVARRIGSVYNIQVTRDDGALMAGIPVTVTLKGPATFDATGTRTWSGRTGTKPITLTWTSTGNDHVPYTITYQMPGNKLVKYSNSGSIQDEIGLDPTSASESRPVEGEPFDVFYDFQPKAVSSVTEAGSKVVAHQATVLKDTLHVSADATLKDSPSWMYDGKGALVPVAFEGTAYYTGHLPPTKPGTVPAGARKVGSVTVTATGPGDYPATLKVNEPLDSQFVTWVWRVVKKNQGSYASYVHADWADQWGMAEETTSVPEKVEVDSTVQSNVTKSGTYLVDNLYIDGFDADHGSFEGGAGFAADVDTMDHTLYFFPEGLKVTDANLAKATKIATVQVPARNGYIDRVGSGKFTMLPGNPAGTYVFITSFKGDDRTEPYTSSAQDKHEQVTVHGPEIRTTATDKADGDKTLTPGSDKNVTITDKVCQVKGKGLKVGTTYTLTATAMDKATGKAILDKDGKPYTGTTEFTPTGEEDCASVDVTIPASALIGKKTVMFENVTLDGRTVALHTDINDEGQTVDGPTPPPSAPPTPPATPPTPPSTPPSLPVTGANALTGLAISALTLAGGYGVLRRRTWYRHERG